MANTQLEIPMFKLNTNSTNFSTTPAVKPQAKEDGSVFDKLKTGFTSWINDEDKVCTEEFVDKNNDGLNDNDDGKLSWKEKAESFGKGLLGIVKTAVNHPVMTGLTVAAGVALTVATGGAAAPILCAVGAVAGAGTIAYGGYKAAPAKTDGEAKQAWETMGNGTFATVASALGAKAALKGAGIDTSNMTFGQSIKGVFNYTKNAGSQLINGGFGSGVYIDSNNIAHLTSKSNVSSQMDNLCKSGLSDYVESMNADDAAQYLEFFGKYADGVELNPANDYQFLQAHGGMQLFDKTNNSTVVSTWESISHPLQQVLKYNLNQK